MTFRHIDVQPLTPNIGAMISGVDLDATRSDDVYEEIKQALWRHQVVFLRNQPMSYERYMRLGAVFGEMETHEFFPSPPDYPKIQIVISEGDEPEGNDRWHTDCSFRKQPNLVGVLQLLEVPPNGGDTLWFSAGAAFDSFSAPVQRMLLELEAEHDMPFAFKRFNNYEQNARRARLVGNDPGNVVEQEIALMRKVQPVVHPAVITHPITGRKTLYVNDVWTKRLMGMDVEQSAGLMNMIVNWVKRPEFSVRFRWEPNSIAIWDNAATQHFAVPDYRPNRRVGRRMTCGSFVPSLQADPAPVRLVA